MKKLVGVVLIILLLINGAACSNNRISSVYNELNNSDLYEITMKQDILCLILAYPEYITDVKKEDNKVFLIMKSGNKILYDDKREKSFEQKLASADLQDMMEQKYPLTPIDKLMDTNIDPGRIRCYSFLKEVYGDTKNSIQAKMKNVNINGKKLMFNGSNGANQALKDVMQELYPIAKNSSYICKNVFPSSGTFNYRVIAGTNQLSPHAFGIAIDLARDKRDYWKWASNEQGEKRLAAYPKEIVKIFENNNFIWGGKWSHFDILHYEYRPEIILKAKYFGNSIKEEKEWYYGAPINEEKVNNYIELIENAL